LGFEAKHGAEELVRDYVDENPCMIFGLDSLTTNPYKPSSSPVALDILLTQNFSFQV
jgi:hypothetical protein